MVSKELQSLTDKFLKDFFEISKKEDGNYSESFSFNHLLSRCIIQSELTPLYNHPINALMGMSSFDNEIAKGFFSKRMKGFFDRVIYVISTLNQIDKYNDYRILLTKINEGIKIEEGVKYNSKKLEFIKENIRHIENHYSVNNSCNDFSGVFVVKFKEVDVIYEEKIKKEMKPYRIDFYNKKQERIFYIDKNYAFDKEEAVFDHYKHIADINSFFFILNNII